MEDDPEYLETTFKRNFKQFSEYIKALKKKRKSTAAVKDDETIDEYEYASCCLVEQTRDNWLPWHQLGNADWALQRLFSCKLGQYSEDFNGVLMAFGPIRPPEKDTAMPVVASEPVMHVRYVVPLVVFQPRVGEAYKAVVSECNAYGTVAHLHDTLQCTIRHTNRSKKSLQAGDTVLVRVTAIKVHSKVLQLHADLEEKLLSAPVNTLPGLPTVNGSVTNGPTAGVGSSVNLSALFTPSKPSTSKDATNSDEPVIISSPPSESAATVVDLSQDHSDNEKSASKKKKKRKRRRSGDSEHSGNTTQTSVNGHGHSDTTMMNGTVNGNGEGMMDISSIAFVNATLDSTGFMDGHVSTSSKHKKKKKKHREQERD